MTQCHSLLTILNLKMLKVTDEMVKAAEKETDTRKALEAAIAVYEKNQVVIHITSQPAAPIIIREPCRCGGRGGGMYAY